MSINDILARRGALNGSGAAKHGQIYPQVEKKLPCGHDAARWIESTPIGWGYCHACAIEKKERTPACPHCGIKIGYAFGTGDCGCNEDRYE